MVTTEKVQTGELKLVGVPLSTIPGSCGESACGAPEESAKASDTFLPSIKAYLDEHPKVKSGVVGSVAGLGIMGTVLLFWHYPAPAFALFPAAGAIAGSKIPRDAFDKGMAALAGGAVGFGALVAAAALGNSVSVPTAFLLSGIIGGTLGYVVGEVRSGR